MQKAKLSWLFIINIFLLVTAVISLVKPNLVQSATAGHVVISELQIGLTGDGANEFIELYNPTAGSVNIGGWKIMKKTAGGDPAVDKVLVATIPSGVLINSHGYYLIAHTDYLGSVIEDLTYNADPISSNNTIYLQNGSDIVIDKVGLGSANDFETAAKGNPPANGSVERKANSASTNASMQTGADVLLGNSEDTDDNSLDFINRTAPDPQNSSSTTENPSTSPAPSTSSQPSASASASPSASASASPSATPSVSPSPSASASASPSMSPSASPSTNPSASASPSASPSVSPSATPTSTPSASPSASASASPSATVQPSITPNPSSTPRPRKHLVCEFKPKVFKFGRFEFTYRMLDCDWVNR